MNPLIVTPLRSLKTSIDSDKSLDTVEKVEFAEFIVESCKRFSCPIPVAIGKNVQSDPVQRTKSGKKKHKQYKAPALIQITAASESDEIDDQIESAFDNTLTITTIYDHSNHFIEILMNKYRYHPIPRILMQLIGITISHYEHLTRLTIKRCKIDEYTLHELGKLLPFSAITDVCLDESPLREGNYEVMLNEASRLQNLSLSRCQINDAVCEKIAARLHYLKPAQVNLFTLNLSSNSITDVGAKHLAVALRSNRHLRYLNLADNLLSDEGAKYIFEVLTEFTLTHEETFEKRHRYILYSKKKLAIYNQCLDQLYQKSPEHSIQRRPSVVLKKTLAAKGKTSSKKRKSDSEIMPTEDNIPLKAELMAKELVGPFTDPFCPSSGRIKDGNPTTIGNFTLCYLNLGYNDLTYASIDRLLSVLEYQHDHLSNTSLTGLLKVVLDGNLLPSNSAELDTISGILNQRTFLKHSGKSAIEKKGPLLSI